MIKDKDPQRNTGIYYVHHRLRIPILKTNNALHQPHIQQHLKDTTKYINGFLKSNGGGATATLGSQNDIKIKNEQGVVVKTYQGEQIAHKKPGVDTYA